MGQLERPGFRRARQGTALISVFLLVAGLAAGSSSVVLEGGWQVVGPGGGGHLTSFVVDHSDPKILYTSVNCGGIRRSVDSGASWEMCNGDFDYEHEGLQAQKVSALAQHPKDPNLLLAALFGGHVWESNDRGAHWSHSYSLNGLGKDASFSYFAFDPQNPDVVYTSVGGNIDRLLTPVKEGVRRHLEISTAALLRGRRAPGGSWTWSQIGELSDARGQALNSYSAAVNPAQSSEIFLVTRAGLYRGTIEGDRLRAVPVDHRAANLPDPQLFDGGKIVFDARHEGLAYLTVMSLSGAGGGFFRSEDGGKTWSRMAQGLDTSVSSFYDFQLHPTDDRVLYLAQFRSKLYEGKAKGKEHGALYRSTDRGARWEVIADASRMQWGWKEIRPTLFGVTYVAVSAKQPQSLYFVSSAGQVFATDDASAPKPAWRQIVTRSVGPGLWTTTGLEAAALPPSIGIDPKRPETLYIPYGDHGVFKSEDGGRSLRLLPRSGSNYGGMLVVDERTPGRIYLATRGPHLQLKDGEVLQSDDGGQTWEHIGGEAGAASTGEEESRKAQKKAGKRDRGGEDRKAAKQLREQGEAGRDGSREDRRQAKEEKRQGDVAISEAHESSARAGTAATLPRGAMTGLRVQYVDDERRNLFVCNYAAGLFTKQDDGAWVRILDQPKCHALAASKDFRELFAAVDGEGIFRVARSEVGWESELLLPASFETGDEFFAVEVGTESGTVYFGASKGVFALSGGKVARRLLEMRDAMALSVHPARESLMYAGSPYRGVWRSTDRGRNWADAGLPQRAVMVLALSPAERDTIYAASRCSGVWKHSFP
jgi:photosystem II stability/assembly factor-like uncharacterized protein